MPRDTEAFLVWMEPKEREEILEKKETSGHLAHWGLQGQWDLQDQEESGEEMGRLDHQDCEELMALLALLANQE